jgi:hypothetical protein
MSKFDEFWRAYPNRKGKGAAAKKYEKIDDSTHKQILLAIEAQKKYRAAAAKTGEFLPEWCMPATWLNQQRWLDEIASHAELKEKAASKICIIQGCSEPVHAEKDAKQYCYHHYSYDERGKLRGGLILVDKLRQHYLEHPEIHELRGKAAFKFMKYAIGKMKIVGGR